jgi:hypothetical protein
MGVDGAGQALVSDASLLLVDEEAGGRSYSSS